MIAYAAEVTDAAKSFVAKINAIILFPFITLITAVALVIFLFGCFEYVKGAANETSRASGRSHILWGIIGLLVMLSAYTILSIAAGTFGIDVPEPIGTKSSSVPSATQALPVATLPDGTVPLPPRRPADLTEEGVPLPPRRPDALQASPVSAKAICSTTEKCFNGLNVNDPGASYYKMEVGEPVRSIGEGEVTFVSEQAVIVQHSDGTQASYEGVAATGIKAGDTVGKGNIIGTTARSNNSIADSLYQHYGITDNQTIMDVSIFNDSTGRSVHVDIYAEDGTIINLDP